MHTDAERDHTLALLLTPGIGHRLATRCVEAFGSAAAAVEASSAQLARVPGIGARRGERLRQDLGRVLGDGAVEREKELIAQHGVHLLSSEDADYPRLLRYIPDPPRLLWVRGTMPMDDVVALAIVGARRATHYGKEQAERFAALAADAGLTIVSGGAYGIDAAAHRGALKVGGRTIAVIGSGLADPYPSEHAGLFDRIANSGAGGGAVVSELPMRTPPQPKQFPARNRIISGLSLGVLVIEAAIRSGALITARQCVEEHGRTCMALPGRVDSPTSEGCHRILREGWATLVTNLADVLDCLGDAGQVLKAGIATQPTTSPREAGLFDPTANDAQRRILAAAAQPATLDQLVTQSGLPVERVQSELTMLEIRGLIRRSGGLFTRPRH